MLQIYIIIHDTLLPSTWEMKILVSELFSAILASTNQWHVSKIVCQGEPSE
jgi:hypothetical protein